MTDEVNQCPTCNSDNISIVEYHVFCSDAHLVECLEDECESRWYELWKFIDIEMIEGKDNRGEKDEDSDEYAGTVGVEGEEE